MAEITLFAHGNNPETRQQTKQLQRAGNTLNCKDILTQNWTLEKLLPFVRGRDPIHFMDSAAAEIRNGSVDPVLLAFDEAVDLMLASPSLIKGPLVEVDGLSIQGFEDSRLHKYLGKKENHQRKIVQRKREKNNDAGRESFDPQSIWNPFFQKAFA